MLKKKVIPKPRAKVINDILRSKRGGKHVRSKSGQRDQEKRDLEKELHQDQ